MASGSPRSSSFPYHSSTHSPPLASSSQVIPPELLVDSVSNNGSHRLIKGDTYLTQSTIDIDRRLPNHSRGSNTSSTTDDHHRSQIFQRADQASIKSDPWDLSIETQTGVDFPSIPSALSSQRTTIFISQRPEFLKPNATHSSNLALEEAGTDASEKIVYHSKQASEMHHLVDKDDYLLARGANPRTGVITSGSHSASSSIDQYATSRGPVAPLPARWRQRGDEWFSLDHGEPSPSTTPPVSELNGFPYQNRPPGTFGHNSGEATCFPAGSQAEYAKPAHISHPHSYDSAATFHLRPVPEGIGMFPDVIEDSGGHPGPPLGRYTGLKVRRKPVGSGPANRSIDEGYYGQKDSSGSTDTVVRRLHFSHDIRSSSAPNPPKARHFTPADVGKDLPSLPQERPSFEHRNEVEEPPLSTFLGQTTLLSDPPDPCSRTSGTSGHRPAEKDLPCLPMSNGQSPLTPERNQGPPRPQREGHEHMMTQPLSGQQKVRGPRGGDPVFPFVRATRPIHHQPGQRAQGQFKPAGAREMPVPIYDNPPVKFASRIATTEPGTRGPRPMPVGTSTGRLTTQRIDPCSQLFSTTTIHTDTPMDPKPPLHNGIRLSPPLPAHRMMNHERIGSLPSHPRARPYDMFMNTGTSIDSMTSIAMPRIRPRAMARPPIPMRGEGSYGVPRVGPTYHQPYPTNQEYLTERDLGRTDSQMWTAAYQEERCLIPQPLKPRQVTSHGAATSYDPPSMRLNEGPSSGLGLTRKCSRCQHGLVGISLVTDGTTRTYDLGSRSRSKEENTQKGRPAGTVLPHVQEEKSDAMDIEQPPGSITTHDERDHSICCPDCCKEQDCHDGCLGHPSPHSTPNTSPTKSIWSEAECPSSSSEAEDSEDDNDKDSLTSEKFTTGRLAFVKSAFKQSPRLPYLKSGNTSPSFQDANTSIRRSPVESSPPLGSPSGSSSARSDGNGTEGLNAAMSAAGSSRRQPLSHTLPKRQRSSSSPMIEAEEFGRKNSVSHSQRSVSGPRLRVPTPRGLAITCSGNFKARNVSGSSISTLELQVPGLGSLGLGVVGEMIIVPFEATKMWIRNHPQVMKLGWQILERAWQMSQVIATTAWRLWALIFVYSKTGKFKLNVAKKESTGGFLFDCARSGVYLLIFIAVGVFAMRVLNILIGALGLIGWLLQAFFWVTRQVLGFGMVR